LGRVLSLFHRRGIEIERLTAERSKNANVLRVAVEIQASPDQIERIEANLYKLIDVLLVENGDRMQREDIDDAWPGA
jgi:acetolactate synthase small subunit